MSADHVNRSWATAAIPARHNSSDALSYLEQGHGRVSISLLQIPRADIMRLRQEYPKLAARFEALQNESKPPKADRILGEDTRMCHHQSQSQEREEAAKELDDLIATIRQQPDFHDFAYESSDPPRCEMIRHMVLLLLLVYGATLLGFKIMRSIM